MRWEPKPDAADESKGGGNTKTDAKDEETPNGGDAHRAFRILEKIQGNHDGNKFANQWSGKKLCYRLLQGRNTARLI